MGNQHDEPTSIDIINNEISSEQKVYLTTNIILNSTAFENSEYDEEKLNLKTKPPKQSFSVVFSRIPRNPNINKWD